MEKVMLYNNGCNISPSMLGVIAEQMGFKMTEEQVKEACKNDDYATSQWNDYKAMSPSKKLGESTENH